MSILIDDSRSWTSVWFCKATKPRDKPMKLHYEETKQHNEVASWQNSQLRFVSFDSKKSYFYLSYGKRLTNLHYRSLLLSHLRQHISPCHQPLCHSQWIQNLSPSHSLFSWPQWSYWLWFWERCHTGGGNSRQIRRQSRCTQCLYIISRLLGKSVGFWSEGVSVIFLAIWKNWA